MKKKIVYAEPSDYFPKEIRKKYKLGEYADENSGIRAAVETSGGTLNADGNEAAAQTNKTLNTEWEA